MEGFSLEPTAPGEKDASQKTAPVSAPISAPVVKAKVDPAAELIANLKKQMEGFSLEPTPTGEKGENSLGIPPPALIQSLAQGKD